MVNSEFECCQACDTTYNCRAFTYWQETDRDNRRDTSCTLPSSAC